MFIHDIYKNIINYTKGHVSSKNLDYFESLVSLLVPAFVSSACLSIGLPNNLTSHIFNIAFSIGSGVVGSRLFNKFLKGPAIDQEIEKIVADSKNDSSPTALFIHTKNDQNGALSYFHSNIDTYRKCALRYSIDRIRGLSYEERLKVQGKKYDIISILSHGQTFSISMDGNDFFSSFHQYSAKKLQFLAAKIKKGGKLILEACSTAEGENNIAKAISAHIPDAVVYGSSATLYNGVGLEYAADMTPTFNNGRLCKGKDTTCIYKGGIHVHS